MNREISGIRLIQGDCLDVMKGMKRESFDAIVTDPPAGINFMGQKFDSDRGGRAAWCGWLGERMAEALRTIRPGGYALVWAIPRRSHWTALALEDAGWEISDRICSLNGQGFPKHKSKLKPAIEDWWLCRRPAPKATMLQIDACRIPGVVPQVTQGVTRRAVNGEAIYGMGHDIRRAPQESNPHPAGRWPAHLVLVHSPGCRAVGTKRVKGSVSVGRNRDPSLNKGSYGGGLLKDTRDATYADADGLETVEEYLCVDGCAVKALDEMAGDLAPDGNRGGTTKHNQGYGEGWPQGKLKQSSYRDSGGPSRFFNTFSFESDYFVPYIYVSKASRTERNAGLEGMPERRSVDDDWVSESRKDKPSGGKTSPQANHHPTVKPLALMKWLCRLICPPGGTVLDLFMGSGTTGLACHAEGLNFVGIESDPDYFEIASRRISACRSETPLFDKAT